MKWLSSVVALIAAVSASPLEKRAGVNDVATVGYATMNGGTTGGSGGTVTTVTSLAALQSAVSGDAKKIVIISGTITGNTAVRVGSNTSVLGAKGSQLNGVGLRALDVRNVIIRNVKVSKVLASAGDAIGVQSSSQVWIDHVDLSSDKDHDKVCGSGQSDPRKYTDLVSCYDGLLDITHAVTGITVSNSKLSNHYKGSLIGAADTNTEDVAMTVTYVGNYFKNIGSRTPSFRFGRGHIHNNYYESCEDGINTRVGAQLLVENNVWTSPKRPLYSTDGGYAVARGNDFGGGSNTAPAGNFNTAPYQYSLLATGSVKSSVTANAGQTLTF
ncbi:hypothetical protein AAF712_004869 [Marasmius tenuissimus]|uniref:Pectate lyase domain-containing protein n=1 Tax=Marasmius tenuissimus TaxID=585030 RepID=A0ABR3A3N8_9AGAR